ncbi:MAG: tRNA (adenosine(37)-N6)-threonylcarbamoyltransferase complex ATPase subunit type 1 TsaE [Acidobacteria bacterium]|nr:tRNA (adenosine(37)-N6)-threonylcarbamoyltransferase complex ATPase subunit type 1 TsaE [Acidobacteriota bacterium]MCB9397535.1 tRNA (adenosine(37)-N6)-threonylcarbamoyltransferase complex ATPase subunit type 1 TsaE [Acidobacteriota bacterium]
MSTIQLNTSFYSESPEATQEFAAQLAGSMRPGQWVLLHGPMGAGKTHFVRGFMRGLGMQETWRIDSPTFTIMNFYDVGPGVHHLDLFRLQDPNELDCLNIEDLLLSPSFKCVEWPDPLAPWLNEIQGYFIHIQPAAHWEQARTLQMMPLGLSNAP